MNRVGGQLLTVEQDGFVMETGATVPPGAYSSVMRLARPRPVSSIAG